MTKNDRFKKIPQDIVRGATMAAGFLGVIAIFAVANATYTALSGVNTGDVLSKDAWNQMVANFDDLNTRVGASSSVPSGAVMAFNLSTCPTGWSEYAPAYGRFIRGIDKSGTSIDPSGQRAAWNVQNDELKSHTHSFTTHGEVVGWPNVMRSNWAVSATTTTSAAGWSETRPKNVALLYCVKN